MTFINDKLSLDKSKNNNKIDNNLADSYAKTSIGSINAFKIKTILENNILGQKEAIDSIFNTTSIIQAGITDKFKPLASHLFVGPTGTGKTEIVRQLANIIRKGPDDFCQIDMSSLSQEHYVASFSGAPPGYSGSKENLSLFNLEQIEGDMYTPGIVLFDEIEKAHPVVIRSLLHVLDRGILFLANGQQKINFRNCIIFMTSNLGSRKIMQLKKNSFLKKYLLNKIYNKKIKNITIDALTDFFDPEFLNRIDRVIIFNEINLDIATAITKREMNLFKTKLSQLDINIDYDEKIIDKIAKESFDEIYGARTIKRYIRDNIITKVSTKIIEIKSNKESNKSIKISIDNNKINIY